ncbi:hypothetical protein [Microscilla marina]|nr:hypothetical protein [Microscilla marina]
MNTQPTKIDFVQYHQPGLESGEYQLTISQTLSVDDEAKATPSLTRNFHVAGERFHLQPEHIHSVFPPAHSQSDYANVFPHVLLSRNTLPWEREVYSDDNETPWLALLVVHENEMDKVSESIVAIGNIAEGVASAPDVNNLEPGQTNATKVAVVDIKKSLLDKIMPNEQALRLLTHVRQTKDNEGNLAGHDMATVVANRLPKKGEQNTVYLVSLENRLKSDGTFNYQRAGTTDKVRLVKLHSWEFTSTETIGDFATILKNMDSRVSTLRLPDSNTVAAPYLKNGLYPLPHRMRQGAQTVSWYHGPLSPRSNAETFDFPAKGADALVRYYEKDGMFDVSYAAAWELGRLLALQNTHFSTSLYQWKRRYAKTQRHGNNPTHLAGSVTDTTLEALPAQIRDWLTKLENLEGVPFNYLVPDEELLPVESIRFFQLDRLWMEALLDGAFSMGRVTSGDHALDDEIRALEEAFVPSATTISGFIMRSEAVAGWPGMQVEGKTANDVPLELIRRVALSPNVMLCLFKGDLQTLDLHLKPEVLHFGVAHDHKKALRDVNGQEIDKEGGGKLKVTVPFNDKLVLELPDLSKNISTKKENNDNVYWSGANPTSTHLALQMLEGVELVRFTK